VDLTEPLIQLIEIEISQPLRRIIPDGHILSARVTIDDLPQQPECVGAFDLPGDDREQCVLIDGRVELRDIHLEAKPVAAHILHRQPTAGMEAAALDAGETVRVKHPCPDRLQDAHQAVMYDPVRIEGELIDFPLLWLVNRHGHIRRGPEGPGHQYPADTVERPIQIAIAGADDLEARFPSSRISICLPDILPIYDLFPKHSVSLHNLLRRRGSPRLLAAVALRCVFCPRSQSPGTWPRVQPGGVSAAVLYPTRSAPRHTNT
jgi:hypothetical protein